ncbi:hypothetical protein AB4027_04800 [Alkalibacterium putridalgicola]|uniref:hypothetical protein n=1 Tax=Alkalibacterium putridalgicola TaxID=426703 RepID=UPI0034CF4207
MVSWNNNDFLGIMSNLTYNLPIEPSELAYEDKLENLLEDYQNDIKHILDYDERTELNFICNKLNEAVNEYYNGFPSEAYKKVSNLMDKLDKIPLGKLEKMNSKLIYATQEGMTPLYRMTKPFKKEGEEYSKKNLFHLPYKSRKYASSCRYSIAGYPSLYLGTSKELCASEINLSSGLVSKYQFSESYRNPGRPRIVIYDFAIKPSDFLSDEKIKEIRKWTNTDIKSTEIRKNYVFWYPLIAACSFIRPERDKELNGMSTHY